MRLRDSTTTLPVPNAAVQCILRGCDVDHHSSDHLWSSYCHISLSTVNHGVYITCEDCDMCILQRVKSMG